MTGLLAAVVLSTGCTQTVVEYERGTAGFDSEGEVAYVRDGVRVYPNPPSDDDADIDPCSALTTTALETLGLTGLEAAALPSYTPDDGCRWAGVDSFSTPSLELRVNGFTDVDAALETTKVAGVPVVVFSAFGNTGRYLANFDDLTLSVDYLGAQMEIDARDALDLAMADVLDAYGRTQ